MIATRIDTISPGFELVEIGMGRIPGKIFVRVRRITLPRYEVEYRQVAGALKDARQIKESGAFAVEHQFAEQVGQEVVLDPLRDATKGACTASIQAGETFYTRIND